MSSKVYVIFENDNNRWWSFLLKKGIRHCFILKPTGNDYIVYGKNTKGFALFTVKDEKRIILLS